MPTDFFAIFGKYAFVVSASVAAAYGLFMFAGRRWIDSRFAKGLEEFKHAQSKEIEELRYRINSIFDRRRKLHDREFEVLPQVWSKLNDATNHLSAAVSLLQTFPDIGRMTDIQLEEFLAQSELLESEKAEVRGSTDRNKTYQNIRFFHDVRRVRGKYIDFRVYYKTNSIFMPEQIQEKLSVVDELMWTSILDREFGYEYKEFKKWGEASTRVREEITPLLDEIESLIKAEIQRDLEP